MLIVKAIISGIAGLLVIGLAGVTATNKGKYDSKTTGMAYALCVLLTVMAALIWM